MQAPSDICMCLCVMSYYFTFCAFRDAWVSSTQCTLTA